MDIFEDFKNGDLSVRCATQEQARLFIGICFSHGLRWRGAQEDKILWSLFESESCYCCNYYGDGKLTIERIKHIDSYMSFNDFMYEYTRQDCNWSDSV